ncbi:MAG: large subunit ribosomal protein [Clostridiales bacterium]|jgi:large subunit ribosomal protein L7A|nr:large subunit ribosomal protein [Clostridiales bacterium]MDK2932491.1 large subunit ribosomal protein [Clostridiales bacterium]
MLDELKTANKVVGIKQAKKAIQNGSAKKVFIAKDAEERVICPIKELCLNKPFEVEYVNSMKELGKACGIDVGAAVAVLIEN